MHYFKGYVDAVRDGRLCGWCQQDGRSDAVNVELLFSGERHAVARADLYRDDLKTALGSDGRHGFSFDLQSLDWESIPLFTPDFLSVRAIGAAEPLPVSRYLPGFMPGSSKMEGPYLARFLTDAQKLACQITSNRFWLKQALRGAYQPFETPAQCIWDEQKGDDHLAISLHHANFAPLEGEFALDFRLNNEIIYTLTFAVMPGQFLDCDGRLAAFIGGLQGRPGCQAKIRTAARLNAEIQPATALLIALRALCRLWGIPAIGAVSAYQHISFDTAARQEAYAASYDEFWKRAGATGQSVPGKFYVLPVEAPACVPVAANRRRALQRRRRKDELHARILTKIGDVQAASAH